MGQASKSDAPGKLSRPVVLVGLMGAGKSSVGLRLANALGVEFIDSDNEIERAANMTIPEIFEKMGEEEFRSGERRVIARLITETPRVIATGGGAFMNAETRAAIEGGAVSVWLNASLDTLVSRTEGRTHRPLLAGGNPREILARLIDERYPVYELADVAVVSRVGQTHEEMAARIIEALARHGRAFATEAGDAQA
ncbi:MAG: shikimate kinase [Pseudomonadota bacterium]